MFQKAESPSESWMTTEVSSWSFGAEALACGRLTGTDWILFSDRVKRTKVASRKKITSIRGMISMRAFLAGASWMGLPKMEDMD